MRRLHARTCVRRGLVVALDGIAVWLLAVVLAIYVAPGSVAGGGGSLLSRSVETTRLWAETPGAGPFELVAYAGIGLTAVGSLWYWVVRPVAARLGRDRSTGDRDRDGDGFRYDRPSTSGRRRANPAGRDRRPIDAPGSDLPGRGESDGLRRVAHLFDPVPPPGGFLRGGSGRDADGSELPPAGAEAPSDDMDPGDQGTTTGDQSADRAAEPADSIDVVASAVPTSRTRIDTVSGRLRAAADGSDVEAAGAELASIAEAAEETLRPLRTIDQDGADPAHRRIEAVRAEQRRIESASAAVLNGR